MTQVISFEDFVPPARYDAIPWTQAQIEEAATATGIFTLIDTLNISPVDTDPAHPASRNFTTSAASDTEALWYRLIFLDAIGNDALPTFPIQNVPEREPYASVDELATLLKVNATTRHAALRRVLISAADEIDAELGLTAAFDVPPKLAIEVNLERAVEHWQQMQSPFGLVGLGAITGGTHTATDSWNRHANKLAPLKESWGLA